VDKPLKSVPHGQCDARPTVTFPAAEHHRPLAGTKLYCLVTRGTWVLTTWPELLPGGALAQSRPLDLKSDMLTTTPPSHLARHKMFI